MTRFRMGKSARIAVRSSGVTEAAMLGFGVSVHAVADHPQRIDVQPGVGLVEDGDLWLEQLQLKNLVALLLPAGETLVDAALGEGRVDLERRHRSLDLFDPVPQLRGFPADRGCRRA